MMTKVGDRLVTSSPVPVTEQVKGVGRRHRLQHEVTTPHRNTRQVRCQQAATVDQFSVDMAVKNKD